MNSTEIKILVVDDDPDLLQGTAHVLESDGYTVARASSGEEAIQTAAAFRPDLVLSDRDMPGMDGLEMCRRLKGHPASADVFVVIISGAHTLTEDQVSGLNSGADGYILRPIGSRELSARVEAFARIVRLTRALQLKNTALEAAMAKVKALSGMLPICSDCKKIRDDRGYWNQVEAYIQSHSEASFTHSLCPQCVQKYFPGIKAPGPGAV